MVLVESSSENLGATRSRPSRARGKRDGGGDVFGDGSRTPPRADSHERQEMPENAKYVMGTFAAVPRFSSRRKSL
jgi:hypothetical protein